MLAPKTFLHIHNFGKSLEKRFLKEELPEEKELVEGGGARFIHWLMYRIGEAPILLDTFAIYQDMRSLREVCFANGSFYPTISFSIDTLRGIFRPKQKVKIRYYVQVGNPFRIQSIDMSFPDSSQFDPDLNILIEDTYFKVLNRRSKPILKTGNLYLHDDFSKTRTALTNILLEQGFITFTQDNIRFSVDTSLSVNAQSL